MDIETVEIPVLSLAYLGDSVYETMVREYLVKNLHARPDALHDEQVQFSNAAFQAKAAEVLLPRLSEDELAVFKTGRNAKTSHRAKGGTVAQYHAATGFEALFGKLWLDGEKERLREIFNIAVGCLRFSVSELK